MISSREQMVSEYLRKEALSRRKFANFEVVGL